MPKALPIIELNINSTPVRLALGYSVCENPGCDCNGINIHLENNSNEIIFFIDFSTGDYRNNDYSKEERDIINAFMDFVKSPQNKKYNLEFFKNYYKVLKERQKTRKNALDSFKHGNLMPYLDIFGMGSAISLTINKKRYVLIDYYCVTPACHCTEIQLEFFEKLFKIGHRIKDFSFRYDYGEKRISDIEGIDYEQAESVMRDFTEKTNETFRKRHNALKTEVESCIPERFPEIMQASSGPTRKLGRNEPCHCGSGLKYKKCCLDKDIQEKGSAMRVAED